MKRRHSRQESPVDHLRSEISKSLRARQIVLDRAELHRGKRELTGSENAFGKTNPRVAADLSRLKLHRDLLYPGHVPSGEKVESRRTAARSRRQPGLVRLLASIYGFETRPRNGKVARLPEATRDQINRMIEDGATYRAIIEKLRQSATQLPYAISEMNLSNWFRSGYAEWQEEQFRKSVQDSAPGNLTKSH